MMCESSKGINDQVHGALLTSNKAIIRVEITPETQQKAMMSYE
jgi:hypothetical protein